MSEKTLILRDERITGKPVFPGVADWEDRENSRAAISFRDLVEDMGGLPPVSARSDSHWDYLEFPNGRVIAVAGCGDFFIGSAAK